MKKQKLVRDKIPEIIKQKGQVPITHIADDNEYLKELIKKLQEEVDEFKEEHNVEELADIIEIVHAISVFFGKSIEELEKIRKEKAEKRGGFKKKIIWEGNK
ncbi:nucleoside triphosphate pyrophosphohydrolase [Candidatus Woesearchaeota archaeon]|nr:nucleoside triphosphate pyrophosphohydrolase [Candidatus Woesearchaeota archaeon]